LRLVAYNFPYIFLGIAVSCILSMWPSHTHSEYVIIIALPLQQWLHESPWMLRCILPLLFLYDKWEKFPALRCRHFQHNSKKLEFRLLPQGRCEWRSSGLLRSE
jgi:hypothetical protein